MPTAGSAAFVVTAEHVIAESLSQLEPESVRKRLGPFPSPLPRLLRTVLKKGYLKVMVGKGSNLQTLTVKNFTIAPRADLCLLIAHPDVDDGSVYPRFAIDSDPLSVGTTVMIAGFPRMHDPRKPATIPQSNAVQREMHTVPEVRTGKIVCVGQHFHHKPVFSYETTSPIPHGMSGGPMFALIDGASTLAVVGMCSYDATTEPAVRDITKASVAAFVIASQNFYTLPDPDALKHNSPGATFGPRIAEPPFGSFLSDFGKRKSELSLGLHEESGSVIVRRDPA